MKNKPDLGQLAQNFASEPETPAPRAAEKKGSGFIPDGDVRLTANIRQDLHLRLKIAAANRRTTIGEILENLIDKHVHQ
jgi:hypothetical protein